MDARTPRQYLGTNTVAVQLRIWWLPYSLNPQVLHEKYLNFLERIDGHE